MTPRRGRGFRYRWSRPLEWRDDSFKSTDPAILDAWRLESLAPMKLGLLRGHYQGLQRFRRLLQALLEHEAPGEFDRSAPRMQEFLSTLAGDVNMLRPQLESELRRIEAEIKTYDAEEGEAKLAAKSVSRGSFECRSAAALAHGFARDHLRELQACFRWARQAREGARDGVLLADALTTLFEFDDDAARDRFRGELATLVKERRRRGDPRLAHDVLGWLLDAEALGEEVAPLLQGLVGEKDRSDWLRKIEARKCCRFCRAHE